MFITVGLKVNMNISVTWRILTEVIVIVIVITSSYVTV